MYLPDSYDKALKRVEELEEKEHVFTADSDDDIDADELGAQEAHKIRQQQLIAQSNALKEAHASKKSNPSSLLHTSSENTTEKSLQEKTTSKSKTMF